MRAIWWSVISLTLAGAGVVRAEPAAEVKAATAIVDREPVNPGTTFKQGETIFVWSSLTDCAGSSAQHVWKRDGKELRTARLPIQGQKWRVNSKQRNAAKGSYTVEVLTEAGQKLGEVQFTVGD